MTAGANNKTTQRYTALYTTYSHVLDGEIRAIAANVCLIVRTRGDTTATLIVCPKLGRRHQQVAQCCRNIQSSFSKCLGIQKVCLGFKRFHKNIDKKYFFKSKNSQKNRIMIWGIHYFITKLKTKIDVIPRSCFKTYQTIYCSRTQYVRHSCSVVSGSQIGSVSGEHTGYTPVRSIYCQSSSCWLI